MRDVGEPQVFENKLHFLDVDEPFDLNPSDVIDGNDDVGVLDWNFLQNGKIEWYNFK